MGGLGVEAPKNEIPRHPVILTRSYEIQQTETTQALWMEVTDTDVNPSIFAACGPDCPVTNLTFFDALLFANAMSAKAGLPPCYELVECQELFEGFGAECEAAQFAGPDCPGYRLPSEAEWEMAARAGSHTCFPDGQDQTGPWSCHPKEPLVETGWFCANSDVSFAGCVTCVDAHPSAFWNTCCGPHPVAGKAPNAYGLFDTSGNVGEITGTVFEETGPSDLEVDPGFSEPFKAGQTFSLRGGSFAWGNTGCCSTTRLAIGMNYQSIAAGVVGIRLARTLDLP